VRPLSGQRCKVRQIHLPRSLGRGRLPKLEEVMERRVFLTKGLVALACSTLSACNHYFAGPPPHSRAHGRRYGGPPPHAPAHGYRHKHHRSGVDLVFDSSLGVYVVADLGYYFHNDRFYRWHDNGWQISAHFRGPWQVVADYRVPPKLFKSKTRFKTKNKFKGKGKFKTKGYW